MVKNKKEEKMKRKYKTLAEKMHHTIGARSISPAKIEKASVCMERGARSELHGTLVNASKLDKSANARAVRSISMERT